MAADKRADKLSTGPQKKPDALPLHGADKAGGTGGGISGIGGWRRGVEIYVGSSTAMQKFCIEFERGKQVLYFFLFFQ